MPARTPAAHAGHDEPSRPEPLGAALTRRRALGLGAAAGIGALLARPLPVLARTGGSAPRSFGLTVTAADWAGGPDPRVSRVLRTRRRFDLVGLRGARADVEVRARLRNGRWSPWVALAPRGDHAPDSGSGERASEPVWTGGSHELQLRRTAPVGAGLRLHFVEVPDAARRAVRPQRVARAAQASAYPAPPPMISRTAWGGDQVPPREAPDYSAVIQLGFVHHTVNANTYSREESPAIVLGIAKYHRDTNGWNDIGYNFLVDRFGQIFEGRAGGVDQPVVGAHAQGWNSKSTGVAIIGTFQDTPAPSAALEAVAKVLGWKLSRHGTPIEGTVSLMSVGGADNRYPAGTTVTFQRISGHRDGCSTTCPGNAAYGQLASIRARARKYTFTMPSGVVAQVSLVAAASKVRYDRQAQLSGVVLRGDGTPAAGEAVLVQRRSGSTWLTIGQATAGADGSWALSIAWHATAQIRAQAGGMSSAPATVACVPVLTVRPTVTKVTAGAKVSVRGTVTPGAPVYVLVERKDARGRWRRVTSVRATVRSGSWSAKARLATAGTYRLTAKAGVPGANAVARPRTVRAVRSAKARKAAAKKPPATTHGGFAARV
jgi:N-acetylmuramoyl-L-alanine amidase